MDLLRTKNLAMKFQIMAEIAAHQPDVQQKVIAKKLGLSPQAVSDYIRELVAEGWLTTEGRSRYVVTKEGINWMLKSIRELHRYSESVLKAIASLSVSAVIAGADIFKGQEVGLVMRDGLLFTTDPAGARSRGVAASNAKKGDDVGISNIEGIVPLKVEKVTVVRIPSIKSGGSKQADIARLKSAVSGKKVVGAMGIEALAALRKAGVEPTYIYGVKEAVGEAARSGLAAAVVCVDDDTAELIKTLEDKGIDYDITDGRKTSSRKR